MQRLLAGARKEVDLGRIFSWARFVSHGSKAVQDIGHFCAHKEDRDDGITWQAAATFCHVAAIMRLALYDAETLKSALQLQLRIVGPGGTKKHFRLKYKEAKRMLNGICEKIKMANLNTLELTSPFTTTEDHMFKTLKSLFAIPTPAFSQEDLISGLINCLTKEHVLEPDEAREMWKLTELVAAFAISLMHQCVIDVGNGRTARLTAFPRSASSDVIVIKVLCPVPTGSARFAGTIFTSTCRAEDWFDTSLLPSDIEAIDGTGSRIQGIHSYWEMPLEMNDAGKLAPIR